MWHQQDGMGCLLPSFPRRYTDSTIHGPIPYARNPDTSWEAPALQENAKPAAWSWLENLRLLLTTISRHGATSLGGNSQLTAFPGERKERNGLYFQCSDFSRECPKEWFLPCLNLNTDKNGPEVESYWKQGWYCGLACLYSPQLSSQHSAEKKKVPASPWGRKKLNPASMFQLFQSAGQDFCLTCLRVLRHHSILEFSTCIICRLKMLLYVF